MNYQEEVYKLCERMRLISTDKNFVFVQAKYGPSKIIKLPLKISTDLSCFIALIIGDGHLPKNKFKVSIETSNKEILTALSQICYGLFNTHARVIDVKKRINKKQTYRYTIYSKAIEELLNIVFKIPRGKKSGIVKIPNQIFLESEEIKKAFIIGILAAEGSRKGRNKVRITSASKNLVYELKELLRILNINSNIEKWFNQKYKKQYYSISFDRIHLNSLMRECRSGQTGQILSIFKKTIGDQA